MMSQNRRGNGTTEQYDWLAITMFVFLITTIIGLICVVLEIIPLFLILLPAIGFFVTFIAYIGCDYGY